MPKITIARKTLSETLDRYEEVYGHPPSPEAQFVSSIDELDELARAALQLGHPVKEWNDFWDWAEIDYQMHIGGLHLDEISPEDMEGDSKNSYRICSEGCVCVCP